MATRGAAGALRRFELDGVRDTGREVGHGSYAMVRELEYHGLKCVGKKIHGILFESALPHEKADMLERFAGECELLSGLHHPCIVQFLGVWFEHGSRLPVLVMEYLHTTLSACLERYGVLPEEISYGVLHDVGLGLRYLHEKFPPIIHRDLSANNVLLTSNMNAKISDLGVAKILNLTPARMTQMTQTKTPGTPCYMPPEAMVDHPKYTSKIDMYSYGVLIIHTLCGRWPFPTSAFHPDPQNPDVIVPVSEVDRRAVYLREIGNDHPLMSPIHQCLSNMPARRPEARTILIRIDIILSTLPQPFTNRVEMLQQFEARIQTLTVANQSKQSKIDAMQSHIDTNRSEIDFKQSQIESLRAEVEKLSVQIQAQQAHSPPSHTSQPDTHTSNQVPINGLHQPVTNQVEMLQQFETHVQSNQSEIHLRHTEIDSVIQSKQSEIESLRAEVERLSFRSPSNSHPSHTREFNIQNQVCKYLQEGG